LNGFNLGSNLFRTRFYFMGRKGGIVTGPQLCEYCLLLPLLLMPRPISAQTLHCDPPSLHAHHDSAILHQIVARPWISNVRLCAGWQ
jgi:hypothetical protein